MDIEETGPAFPTREENYTRTYSTTGITRREYFAAHAPAIPASFEKLRNYKDVVISAGVQKRVEPQLVLEDAASHAARWAYAYADAMLSLGMKP